MNKIKKHRNRKHPIMPRRGLSWEKMVSKMNEDKLMPEGQQISSKMSAVGEFNRIMIFLSEQVWKAYHPGENANLPANKKLIREIARSEYFNELVEDALWCRDKKPKDL